MPFGARRRMRCSRRDQRLYCRAPRSGAPYCWFCRFGLRFAYAKNSEAQPQVPNTNRPLPIQCPRCQHNGSRLVVKSLTVMSVTCANCGHFWATDLESLPPEIQEKIPDALRDL